MATAPKLAHLLLCCVCLSATSCATTPARGESTVTAAAQDREAQALQVLDRFIEAFSARDAAAHVATYHFPHYRLARGEMRQWSTRAEALAAHVALFQTLPDTGWHRSEWLERTVVTSSASKIHVATRFRRLREDGSEIGRFDSLYVLIWQDGRWGIKLRSSFL